MVARSGDRRPTSKNSFSDNIIEAIIIDSLNLIRRNTSKRSNKLFDPIDSSPNHSPGCPSKHLLKLVPIQDIATRNPYPS